MKHEITLCNCDACKKLFSSSSAARRNAESLIKRLDRSNAWPEEWFKIINYRNIELSVIESFLDPFVPRFTYKIRKHIG